ncbi:MAG: glycosyltransferase [Candidatus Thermoplasmatota archaeon]|nr:glycosyltransferase [Candidatus Thermoplasmatota archaeon]MCL5800877.1 glycosyltransferase [Candidatus Thermoplasmatota archaeon]
MKNSQTVSILYESPKQKTGVYRYSKSLINVLQGTGLNVEEFPIRYVQPVIFGKPIGGWISQEIGSMLTRPHGVIVHSTSPHVVARRTNVVTIHDLIRYKLQDIYPSLPLDRKYAEYIIRRSLEKKRIIAVSHHVKDDIIRMFGVDPDRIDVVYFNVDTTLYHRISGNPFPDDGKIHLILVTDYNPRKRLDKLLPELSGRSDMDIYIIGRTDVWPRQYSYAKEYSDRFKNIHILGYLEFEGMRAYLSAADLFVYHTVDEGIGMPPVEAMACGTNTLVNDIPVFREFLKDKSFYFTEEDNIADKVLDALNHKRNRDELIQFASYYSISNTRNQLLASYSKIEPVLIEKLDQME